MRGYFQEERLINIVHFAALTRLHEAAAAGKGVFERKFIFLKNRALQIRKGVVLYNSFAGNEQIDYGALAQLVARDIRIVEVRGSTPLCSTKTSAIAEVFSYRNDCRLPKGESNLARE